MIEGHDFIDGYFINNDYDIVETLWYSPTEDVYRTHVVMAEDGDIEWEKLKKLVSVDDLMERTYIRASEQRDLVADAIVAVAADDEDDWKALKEELARGSATAFLDALFLDKTDDDENNKEKLFIFKLALFEWDPIKNSKNKELKKALRKSTSILQAVHLVTSELNK